jgi:ubiquinone/menaquinone biosynthesis C-methylase UbiE
VESCIVPRTSDVSAFDFIADSYDETFTETFIGRAQRRQVWQVTDRLLRPGDRVLEINCGTGVDALHLAQRGLRVLACDSSPRMVERARRRVESAGFGPAVDLRILGTEAIAQLGPEGPFDGVLSNFAGLNCIEDLSSAAQNLARLLKPRGKALICLFGSRCLWEIAWHLAHADSSKAFRRFRGGGTRAHLGGGTSVHVQYPSVRQVRRIFDPHLRLKAWKGIGIVVPPSYLGFLAVRFPGFFRAAEKVDPWLGRCPAVRGWADHVLLTFEKGEI